MHKISPLSLKKTCDIDIHPSSITKVTSVKSKTGQPVVRAKIPNINEKIALLKMRKTLAAKKVYVNEALTTQRFHLLMAAKSLCRSKQIFSAWSRSGKIFIKKSESAQPYFIRDMVSLDQLIA
jgi:hypothetical protein